MTTKTLIKEGLREDLYKKILSVLPGIEKEQIIAIPQLPKDVVTLDKFQADQQFLILKYDPPTDTVLVIGPKVSGYSSLGLTYASVALFSENGGKAFPGNFFAHACYNAKKIDEAIAKKIEQMNERRDHWDAKSESYQPTDPFERWQYQPDAVIAVFPPGPITLKPPPKEESS